VWELALLSFLGSTLHSSYEVLCCEWILRVKYIVHLLITLNWFDGCCLRLITFFLLSHELTRSGNSTGSVLVVVIVDWGIYQLFVEVWDRRIFTFNFGSIVLELDDDDDDDIDGFSFPGTSICKGRCSEISDVVGSGFFWLTNTI